MFVKDHTEGGDFSTALPRIIKRLICTGILLEETPYSELEPAVIEGLGVTVSDTAEDLRLINERFFGSGCSDEPIWYTTATGRPAWWPQHPAPTDYVIGFCPEDEIPAELREKRDRLWRELNECGAEILKVRERLGYQGRPALTAADSQEEAKAA